MSTVQSHTGGIAATNGFYLKQGEDELVVDAPDGMADWLLDLGASPQALLLTHAHFDHVQDANAIHQRWGCPIYAFATPTPELTLESLLKMYGAGLGIDDYPVHHQVKEGESLVLGGWQFGILHIPGHSPDSVAFVLEAESLVFGGDVLFAGGIGRDDFPGGNGELLRQGIREKLYTMPDATMIYSGHGVETTIGHEKASNPFVRPDDSR